MALKHGKLKAEQRRMVKYEVLKENTKMWANSKILMKGDDEIFIRTGEERILKGYTI